MRAIAMSCRKPDRTECKERPFGLLCLSRLKSARAGEGHKNASNSCGSFVLSIAQFTILCALAFVCWGAEMSRAQVSDVEKASYADALAYCRGFVGPPMVLRSDKRVLCLDGLITAPLDLWTVDSLERGGLFVVRSYGGDISVTIALADALLAKEATVIINDYCLVTCANYLLIASTKTFVPKDALVAWALQASGPEECLGFSETTDPTAPHFRTAPCAGPFFDYTRAWEPLRLKKKFYDERVFAPSFLEPPESVVVRRTLKRKYDAAGKFPEKVYWTWNPRFYASAIKTKVVYEAYPESQEEVDAILARLGVYLSVIYDP